MLWKYSKDYNAVALRITADYRRGGERESEIEN